MKLSLSKRLLFAGTAMLLLSSRVWLAQDVVPAVPFLDGFPYLPPHLALAVALPALLAFVLTCAGVRPRATAADPAAPRIVQLRGAAPLRGARRAAARELPGTPRLA